jgi:hypothetical protein
LWKKLTDKSWWITQDCIPKKSHLFYFLNWAGTQFDKETIYNLYNILYVKIIIQTLH